MLTVYPPPTGLIDKVRKWALLNLWLDSADMFAEIVTLRPVAGPDRSITVHIDQGSRMDLDQPASNAEVERLAVLFSRVPLDEEDTKSYLDNAIVGMQILRAKDRDMIQEPYIFNGEIEYQNPFKWRLVFERHRQISASPRR